MHFEALWLQSGIVLLEVAALVLALVLVRRRAVTPLVVFGGVILVAQGGTLLLMHLPSEGATPPALQVLSLYASIAPFTVLLIYVCVMQARRYMTARNNDRLRTWFLRAPYVCGGSFSAAFLGDIAVWPPLFESTRGISVVGFFIEAQHYVIGVVYASVASLVFFGAAKAGSGLPILVRDSRTFSGGSLLRD